ncbi:MAG TPA: HXXEE domain-containing protein [Chloroflexota bacterium]|nr:HXXEE domain-containing protein [Chloroflexota bacterium]
MRPCSNSHASTERTTGCRKLHQVEEHGHGAFKAYAARLLPQARGLTDETLFVVNVPVTWGVNLAALYLARFDRLAQSMIAPYLALVNGILHLVMALRARRYNPGLWTGLILFLPLGGATLKQVARESRATRRDHLWGVGGAIVLHVLTVLGILFAGKKK